MIIYEVIDIDGSKLRVSSSEYFCGYCKYNGINYILHRLGGPAYIDNLGRKEWCYEGKRIDCSSQEEFDKRILKLKLYKKK
jgi:hypothetical protein